MLASDLQNPEFSGASNPDSLLTVTFYSRPVAQPFESEKEGRPIFKDVDFVKIFIPGDQRTVIDTFAEEQHKKRFPVQWARYQNQKTGQEQFTGTPVSQWPLITQSQAEELRAVKFFTVEQVAEASDAAVKSMGMIGPSLREKAKNYLNAAKGAAEVERRDQELKKRDAEILELKEQMAKLMAAVEQPRRGRHPKVEGENG